MNETSLAAFTPAQRALYDAFARADRKNVEIVRRMIDAAEEAPASDPNPEDFGAPLDTPAWDAIEEAVADFDEATGIEDIPEAIRAVRPVLDAVLDGSQ